MAEAGAPRDSASTTPFRSESIPSLPAAKATTRPGWSQMNSSEVIESLLYSPAAGLPQLSEWTRAPKS